MRNVSEYRDYRVLPTPALALSRAILIVCQIDCDGRRNGYHTYFTLFLLFFLFLFLLFYRLPNPSLANKILHVLTDTVIS